jgi:hypothetical protein
MNRLIHGAWAPILAALVTAPLAAEVILSRVPGGGLQPQALVGRDGTLHLVYFQGEPKAGDLFYVRRTPGSTAFTTPTRVNSEPSSAIAIGTIRGPQIVLGKGDRPHVAWNGRGKATSPDGAPMLYTRLNDDGTAFEPQRDVMTFTSALDGGGSVAADNSGNVYVVWHGKTPDASQSETERAVFVAVSTDEGKTFAPEHQANPEPTGACGCCGMKAFCDASGSLYLLYREARSGTERGATILVSDDHAATFQSLYTHPWDITTCPMSSAWLGPGMGQTLAAWETAGRVWFTRIDSHSNERAASRAVLGPGLSPIPAPLSTANQKHPVAVSDSKGETLLVWTEGTGWMKGGAVAWQVFGPDGKPTNTKGRTAGLPVWSLATAVALPNGNFEIIY